MAGHTVALFGGAGSGRGISSHGSLLRVAIGYHDVHGGSGFGIVGRC